MAASVLALAPTACGGRAGDHDRIASSSWFGSCRDDADCSDGQCLCGVCTLSCQATSCSAGPPGSACFPPGERAHDRFCAGRTAPALCLVPCDDGECSDGFSCVDAVCLPAAVAAYTPDDEPDPSSGAVDAGVEPLPAISLCASTPIVWRSVTVTDQRGYDALEGCVFVSGDLSITLTPDADLTPLGSLQSVAGVLDVQMQRGERGEPLPPLSSEPLSALARLEYAGGLLLGVPVSSLAIFERLRTLGPPASNLPGRGELRLATASLRDLSGLSLQDIDVLSIGNEPELANLVGLGSARVRVIDVSRAGIVDLTGLDAVTGIEELYLFDNPNLESLRGLGPVPALRGLRLTDNRLLETLDGLVAPGQMRQIELASVQIADLGALATLTSVDQLRLYFTSVVTLDALVNLRNAGELILTDTPYLTQVDALQALVSLGRVTVSGNASLLRLPAMPALTELGALTIQFNTVLESGPTFPALTAASEVIVNDNPALGSLNGFGSLQRVSSLTISRNPVLSELDLGALTTVDDRLEVRGVALTASDVASLRALTPLGGSVISTPDAPALLDPCPFTTDALCDEVAGDCAPNTDRFDCSEQGTE